MIMEFSKEVLNKAERICQAITNSVGWPNHIEVWHGRAFPQVIGDWAAGKLEKCIYYRVLAKYGLVPYALEMGCAAAMDDGLGSYAKEAVFNELFFAQVKKDSQSLYCACMYSNISGFNQGQVQQERLRSAQRLDRQHSAGSAGNS